MTTFAPGAGARIKLLDLGACYPAGTVAWLAIQGNWSASWPGNTKRWDIYIVGGATLADLAASEAAVTPGVGGDKLYHTTHDSTTDSTAGAESFITTTNQNTVPFPETYRYLSLYAKPQFSSGISWHTNDTSTMVLGSSGLAGASPTSCPAITPVANFSGTPLFGPATLAVTFTDTSTNSPTSWAWDFGDGGTSTSQNPSHNYVAPGTYEVELTATNAAGSDTETKTAYVVVSSGQPVALDVYQIVPPGDTIEFIGSIEDAYNKIIRPVRNEPGTGRFTINKSSPHALTNTLQPGNLVKVRIPQIDDDYIYAWFIEKGNNTLASTNEKRGEELVKAGPGALSYWDRAMWLSTSFVIEWWPADVADPPAGAIGLIRVDAGRYAFYDVGMVSGHLRITDQDFVTVGAFDAYYSKRKTYLWPVSEGGPGGFKRHLVTIMPGEPHDTRHFHPSQDGVEDIRASYAIGSTILLSDISPDTPGKILYRMFQEGQAPSRPDQPIPLMTIDFDDTVDSNGDPWATTDAVEGLTAELGESYLSTISKLVATGAIDVEMTPNLLMRAFNAQGRDLTGDDFEAGVVRFEKGVNIADQLKREQDDVPVGTFIEVIGTENAVGRAVLPDAASRVAREVSGRGDTDNIDALEAMGLADLTGRLIRSDAIGLSIATGDDDDLGLYYPGPEGSAHGKFWYGDLVRVHTGTDEVDFNEDDLRVYAFTIRTDDADNILVTPEVGSTLGEAERRLYGQRQQQSATFTTRSQFNDTDAGGSSGGSEGHPDLGSHDLMGLATQDELDTVEDDFDTHAASDTAHNIPKRTVTTTDPTTGDDTADGYTIGSRWVNTTTDEEFVATDVSAAAAVWVSTTDQGGGLTSDEVDAIQGANAPDAGNVFATMADVGGGGADWDDYQPPIQTKIAVAIASSLAPVFGTTPLATSLFLCQSAAVAVAKNITSIVQTNVTWTAVDSHVDGGTNAKVEVWKGVPSGGTPGTTVTVTYSGSTNVACEVSEWPTAYGLAGTIDGTSGKATATTGQPPYAHRTATMLLDSLVLSVYGCNNGSLPAMMDAAPFPWLTPLRQTSGLSFWAFGYQWVKVVPGSSSSAGINIGVFPASTVWAAMITAIK